MENKSEAVRLVSELVERANNQANVIEAQKGRLIELRKQLETKYSTESHVLVEREVLQDLSMDFDELADGFRQLDNTFEDITSYANDIANDSEYNDANDWRGTARECISKIEDILDPAPEEEETVQ